ncbi:TIGR00304 family membrane protein [Thermococcus thermotolerans]|uniref:TIGR00304 family membrane protein n=1 Tax=Thermococcus thermotolerans TaxID=2969672 RepID=UPI0021580BD5|nr:DUF131 domain-containing protein [Thermococcus thermotolerans]
MDKGSLLILAGMGMILLGFLLVFIGTAVLALGGEGEVEGGGVIMIGPVPIIFGTGRGVGIAVILAIILMALWIIGALLARRG